MNELPSSAVKTSYEGYYATREGDVWSTRHGIRKLKRLDNNGGYVKHVLRVNGESKNKLVHTIIAETFILNPLRHSEINHENGDKHDCSVENLKWCSRNYNMEHAAKVLGRRFR